MHSQLVLAALAASVSASINLIPGHMAIRRDLVVARQTTADAPSATSGGLSDTECQATLLAIATDLPMPNDDLLSWEQEQTGTDPCSITEVPSSLSAEYTSYTDAVLSWYAESSSELFAALSECPQYAGAVSEVAVCTSSLSAEATATGSSASNATGTSGSGSSASASGSSATQSGSSSSTGTASGSASSSAETAGAAVREVGIVGAVLAGVLGVAVAL